MSLHNTSNGKSYFKIWPLFPLDSMYKVFEHMKCVVCVMVVGGGGRGDFGHNVSLPLNNVRSFSANSL
jgi:hypothetical protein